MNAWRRCADDTDTDPRGPPPPCARLAVRVRDGETILSVARKGAPVGDREDLTFKVNCGVPPGATRYPADGQRTVERDGGMFYQVVYRWKEGL